MRLIDKNSLAGEIVDKRVPEMYRLSWLENWHQGSVGDMDQPEGQQEHKALGMASTQRFDGQGRLACLGFCVMCYSHLFTTLRPS